MKQKAIVLVLQAVKDGAWDLHSVSKMTGIPPKECSKWLCDLFEEGLVARRKIIGRKGVRYSYSPRAKAGI